MDAEPQALPTFTRLASIFGLLPTEVKAVVYATGISCRKAGQAQVVDPDELPRLNPMLAALRDRKGPGAEKKAG